MIRLSNSAVDKYDQCRRLYKYHYIDKIREDSIGSPLFFGSSIDEALNCLLLQKKKELDEEEKELVKQDPTELFDLKFREIEYNNETLYPMKSLKVRYSTADYDEDILQEEDLVIMTNFLVENNFEDHQNPKEVMKQIKLCIKQDGFISLDDEDKIFYNLSNWLSLRRKGHLMITTYYKELMPQIKEVLSIQKKIELPNDDDDLIIGYIDFVAILNDSKTYICDNKTSSMKYKPDSVKESQQLTIYCEAENVQNGAYFVLVKKIRKIKHKTCRTCKTTTTGREKTCKEGGTGKNRCSGEFDVEVENQIVTQVVQDEISEEQREVVFDSIEEVLFDIREGDFEKNTKDNCFHFGRRCPYFKKCWEDPSDMTGLVCTKEEE